MSLTIRIKPRTAEQRESQYSTYSGSSYGQPRNDLALWVNRTRREELQSCITRVLYTTKIRGESALKCEVNTKAWPEASAGTHRKIHDGEVCACVGASEAGMRRSAACGVVYIRCTFTTPSVWSLSLTACHSSDSVLIWQRRFPS